jgi:copper chaperone NosL
MSGHLRAPDIAAGGNQGVFAGLAIPTDYRGPRHPSLRRRIATLVLLAGLGGCGGDPGTGPVEVKWDRTTCDRCRMVLSDRQHAAQVRLPAQEGRSRVLTFDDFGCAIIWLEAQPWRDDPRTEVWVSDWRSGQWLNARAATYLPGQVTPMEYGLGAQSDPAPNGLDFAAARTHVLTVERRYNLHGNHPSIP